MKYIANCHELQTMTSWLLFEVGRYSTGAPAQWYFCLSCAVVTGYFSNCQWSWYLCERKHETGEWHQTVDMWGNLQLNKML